MPTAEKMLQGGHAALETMSPARRSSVSFPFFFGHGRCEGKPGSLLDQPWVPSHAASSAMEWTIASGFAATSPSNPWAP